MYPGSIARGIVVGLVAGTLVGLTGLGGGVLLLPLLIAVLDVPPIVAVGSDAIISWITKIGAGMVHWRQGNVTWPLVFNLAYGSLPGAMVGVITLASLHATCGDRVNDILKAIIGILLITIPVVYLAKRQPSTPRLTFAALLERKSAFGITLIGFVAGVLVGLTSIGSGSLILMLMLIFYGVPPAVMVGTDIAHAILVVGLTALLQFKLGNVNLHVAACVLSGSIPGGIIGAYMTRHLPTTLLRQLLYTVLIAVGVRMLWGTLPHAK